MEVPQANVIQRLPEKLFDLSRLDECCVEDRFGKSVPVKDIRKGFTCIFIFIRVNVLNKLTLYGIDTVTGKRNRQYLEFQTGSHFQFPGGSDKQLLHHNSIRIVYLSTSCPKSNCFECRERFATISIKKI